MSSLFTPCSLEFHEHRRVARADPVPINTKPTGQLTRSWKPVAAPASGHPVPDVDAKGVMTRFVSAYIDEVPDLLDAANDVAREAGIESQIKPVLKIAEHYFLQPPAILAGHEGSTACWTRPTWRIVWWRRSTTCTSNTLASR
jgi:hypothetical protein